mmetsp:Transcript_10557/g.9134  ORF Transcript_10557/g.9134 Transcript_10557/m.9134 type:complete len:95 (+) Transcript_10557:870-1154(+)
MTDTNKFFATIKKEMDKLAVKIKNTDNDNSALQRKSEKADVQILEMLEENAKLKAEIQKSNVQKEGLEKLIETLAQKVNEKCNQLEELKKATAN